MKTLISIMMKHWDDTQEKVIITFLENDNVLVTFDDNTSQVISKESYKDSYVKGICACGNSLDDHASKHFGRCEDHLLIYAPSDEERELNHQIQQRYEKTVDENWG